MFMKIHPWTCKLQEFYISTLQGPSINSHITWVLHPSPSRFIHKLARCGSFTSLSFQIHPWTRVLYLDNILSTRTILHPYSSRTRKLWQFYMQEVLEYELDAGFHNIVNWEKLFFPFTSWALVFEIYCSMLLQWWKLLLAFRDSSVVQM